MTTRTIARVLGVCVLILLALPAKANVWTGTMSCGELLVSTQDLNRKKPFTGQVELEITGDRAAMKRVWSTGQERLSGQVRKDGTIRLEGQGSFSNNPGGAWATLATLTPAGTDYRGTATLQSKDGATRFRSCTVALTAASKNEPTNAVAEAILGPKPPLKANDPTRQGSPPQSKPMPALDLAAPRELTQATTRLALDLQGTWDCGQANLTFFNDGSMLFQRGGKDLVLSFGGWQVNGSTLAQSRTASLDKSWSPMKKGPILEESFATTTLYQLVEVSPGRITLRPFAEINYNGTGRKEIPGNPIPCTKSPSVSTQVKEWRASVPKEMMDGVPVWPGIKKAQLTGAPDALALSVDEATLARDRAAVGKRCTFPPDPLAAETEMMAYHERVQSAVMAARSRSAQCSGYANVVSDQLRKAEDSMYTIYRNANYASDKQVPVRLLHSMCSTYAVLLGAIPESCR